ncbi:AraC family transcriptional regulator [Levilactobacillus acidifarinae]|nr:AraC family transcriptional regulator [Levilactobacillus acidifarinae]
MASTHQFVYTTQKLPVLFIIHPALKTVTVRPHWHEDVELNYTLSDTIDDFTIENEHFTTAPGRILLVNSEQVHSVRSTQSNADGHQPAALTLVFPLKFLRTCYPAIEQIYFDVNHPEDFSVSQRAAYQRLRSLLHQIMAQFNREQNDLTILKIRTLLMLIVTILIEDFSRPKVFALPLNQEKQTRLTTITTYLQQHAQEPLKVADIAASVHLSPEYLIRFFKSNLGTTPYQYLAYIRCQKAQVQLRQSEDSLTVIALRTGFGSLRSINRTFEKFTHTTAKNWRAQNRAGQ